MSQFPEGFMPPKFGVERIAIDDYRYYFTIPVAGEINEIVERSTSGLQGTYEILSKYCNVTMVTHIEEHNDPGMIKANIEQETDEVSLKDEQWVTWHPKHVQILIRWMNEHIFGLKAAELRNLERQSSSANTKKSQKTRS